MRYETMEIQVADILGYDLVETTHYPGTAQLKYFLTPRGYRVSLLGGPSMTLKPTDRVRVLVPEDA